MLDNLSDEERRLFHAAIAQWLSAAHEVEFDQVEVLRAEIAPGEVCSMLRLVRTCFAHPHLQSRLPAPLVALLRERSLLQPCAVAPTLSNAAGRR
ncbi:hypothetical protein [Pseudorhodoferax sp. Leaf267]|jgi:hypothetical protein|uniref:hypothetical protein n=1 Tax=Pseudorhodoferax sp. Leaf267 TaxID=1736316 RepID=UPI000714C6F3|nr:hypothetical protein [Pseudorhodoferax sp. Leaf267]KQP14793.1 hypothetical protein ASF43_12050 [Pseudorhodoferax sp. Leaf267]